MKSINGTYSTYLTASLHKTSAAWVQTMWWFFLYICEMGLCFHTAIFVLIQYDMCYTVWSQYSYCFTVWIQCVMDDVCTCWQMFIHRVFGYRGVVLFPWVGKVYDRDISTKEEKYGLHHDLLHSWIYKNSLMTNIVFIYSLESGFSKFSYFLDIWLGNWIKQEKIVKACLWKAWNRNCGTKWWDCFVG